MALILSIETSTPVCALALHEAGTLLAEASLHLGKSHSSQLPRQAAFLLESTGKAFGDLEGVAVARGPGSYTGLRIGTSFAKGLCYAQEIPLLAIGSLTSMALKVRNMLGGDAFFIPMMDARRMEVYAQVFDAMAAELFPARPVLLEEEDFGAWLEEKPCYFFGDGSGKAKALITHPRAHFIDGIHPGVNEMGLLAWRRFEQSDVDDTAYFEPDYLKEFQATKPKKIF